MKRITLLALAALLLLVSAAAAESGFEPCFRFDSGLNAWQEPLKNVRFLTQGAYTLTPLDPEMAEKFGVGGCEKKSQPLRYATKSASSR